MDAIIIDVQNERLWDSYIDRNKEANFFHTTQWKDIIKDVYGFNQMYHVVIDEKDVQAACPMFYTKSVLFGKKMVTTPFNFYNGVLFESDEARQALITKFHSIAKERNVKYVEYKQVKDIKTALVKRSHYWDSVLKLPKRYEDLKYGKGVARNIRRRGKRATEEGMVIKDCETETELKAFYDVMVRTLRDKHHMIPQPYKLFYKIWKLKTHSKIILLMDNDIVAGGMMLLFFNKKVTDAWTATNQDYIRYSPNSLLLDYAIRYSIENGYEEFDMGVTSPYQESLLSFKESFGCESFKLPTYYDLVCEHEVPNMDYHTSYKDIRKWYRFVPVWLIKLMAPFITRQLG